MELQKINVKFFVENPDGISLTAFIPIFNSWIQASDGDYYDIADYSHMHAGAGIVLVAHEANISMDNAEGRVGLLYNRKQPLAGSNQERLRSAFKSALAYCRRVEEEPYLQGRLRFKGGEALFLVNDRLSAPNTEQTFDSLRPDLEDLARTMYGGAEFALERRGEPKRRFGVLIRTPAPFEIATLSRNLGST